MTLIKKILSDVYYTSKITSVGNKKLILFTVVVLSQLTAFSDVALIVIFSSVITGSVEGGITESLVLFFLDNPYLIPFVVISRFSFTYIQSMTMKKLEMRVTRNIKVYLLKEVFDKRNYSVSDAYFYINQLSGHVSFFYGNLVGFANSLLQTVAFISYLTLADSNAFLAFGVGVIILFYPIKTLIARSRKHMHEIYEYSKFSNTEIQRIVDNMFLIKLLKKEDEEVSNFKTTLEKLNHSEYKNIKWSSLNGYLPSFSTMFIFSILVSVETILKSLTLDFIGVTLKLFQVLGTVTGSVNKIVNSHVHLSKLTELFKNRNYINKSNFKMEKNNNSESIVFENVDFKYFNSDVYIFKNLSLKIPKNKHTILTGANGSGKSTLLGLLSGVFYSESGTVYANCEKFGYIGATPLIFDSSLRENILYGNQVNVTDEEILKELRLFNTFKEESSYNLDRKVDNKSLSSGQMQKIAFIRALVADVDVLILDESTANLDDDSRNLIFSILENKNLTIINSTHDPNQFINIDHHLDIDIIEENREVKVKY
jgi:ABC-type bacteriocin/lantibiotic exporter with double-glycine peptidase domain